MIELLKIRLKILLELASIMKSMYHTRVRFETAVHNVERDKFVACWRCAKQLHLEPGQGPFGWAYSDEGWNCPECLDSQGVVGPPDGGMVVQEVDPPTQH